MPAKSQTHASIGETIRAARQQAGYTQEAFAAHAGIDRSYYGAIERGEFNLTIETVLKVAAGLEIPASELMRRAGL
jgi:transcriptional regulator with XRE-family HTH domain